MIADICIDMLKERQEQRPKPSGFETIEILLEYYNMLRVSDYTLIS